MIYIIYNTKTNKVTQIENNKPLSLGTNLALVEIEELPLKNSNQYYKVDNIRMETRVIKNAWVEEVPCKNNYGQIVMTKVKHEAVTEQYTTCDIIVDDVPPLTEEQLIKLKNEKYEKKVEEFIRKKYSISQELALLRQKDTKPEEFKEYNDYAEQCKNQAKVLIYHK